MAQETDNDTRTTAIAASVGILVAALPHAFFPPPLHLHMIGHVDGFYGIAVWAPAILAGVAFFFGVEFGAHRPPDEVRATPERRAAILAVACVVYVVALAEAFGLYDLAPAQTPADLPLVMAMYAGLWAIESLFWQGVLQHHVLARRSSGARVLAVTVLPVLVLAPFAISGEAVGAMLFAVALARYIAALAFELGSRVLSCMLLSAALGALFIWFQQVMLL